MKETALPTTHDLEVIMDQIWSAYVDPDGTEPFLPGPGGGPTGYRAWVMIDGSWSGQVILRCSAGQAAALTSAFLSGSGEQVSAERIVDVLGELANIVGGNVKGMLPTDCVLSQPHVAGPAERGGEDPWAVPVCELSGTWLDEPLDVSVWARTGDGRRN
jgi:chemotaxis protein CheX